MSLFGKLFRNSKDKSAGQQDKSHRDNLPLDQRFVLNFKDNGGVFIYCETMQEVLDAFDGILGENMKKAKICCPNQDLNNLFSVNFERFFTNNWQEATMFLTECEYLIAYNGSILFSSNQFGQKRSNELPDKMIVFARTSQIVAKIDDGMGAINQREKFPSNITTLENFGRKTTDDYLNYGSRAWKMYLILLEDLN